MKRHVNNQYNTRVIDNFSSVLLEQWIRAKYERKEFVQASTNRGNRPYESGRKEGFLWKRGKEDKRYQRRWFVLDASENTLRYYNGENVSRLRNDQICFLSIF